MFQFLASAECTCVAAAMGLLCGGCAGVDVVNQPMPSFSQVVMQLTSNRSDTVFRIRPQRVNASADWGWKEVGVGQAVFIRLGRNARYEIAAIAPGYIEKRTKLADPVKHFQFRFLDSDRLDADDRISGISQVTCDVRVLDVATGSAVRAATAVGSRLQLDDIATRIVADLELELGMAGSTVAVAVFRSRGGSQPAIAIARELADKVAGKLILLKTIQVKERIELGAILDERDLQAAGLIDNPDLRKRLEGVDFLIIGAISVLNR